MAIVTRTFISKSNTIIEGDNTNLGLNPIMELYYGIPVSRGLIYFDLENVRRKIEDKTYPDIEKLHHTLKMQNVASLKSKYGHKFNRYNDAERASSFDLVLFLVDKDWDAGKGYDFYMDGYDTINRIHSTEGSNWFNCKNGEEWNRHGVFGWSVDNSLYIGKIHFDKGNENIEYDLTEIVNKMLNNEIENHGICIAFDEQFEDISTRFPNYVGFFTDNTHTFFKPYLETTYDEYIKDDRTNFFLDKPNRLYFYANVGGKMVNLDNIPTCIINDTEMTVKQATKGVYYTEINLSSTDYEPETMLYDKWYNISYNSNVLPDKELYFTTKAPEGYYSFGLPYETKQDDKIVPFVYGINHKEEIEQGDIRKLNVVTKIAYTTRQEPYVNEIEYHVYVKAGDAVVDAIGWTPVECGYNEKFFYINTNEFVPEKYFVGIKIKKDYEETIYDNLMEFTITDKNKSQIKC